MTAELTQEQVEELLKDEEIKNIAMLWGNEEEFKKRLKATGLNKTQIGALFGDPARLMNDLVDVVKDKLSPQQTADALRAAVHSTPLNSALSREEKEEVSKRDEEAFKKHIVTLPPEVKTALKNLRDAALNKDILIPPYGKKSAIDNLVGSMGKNHNEQATAALITDYVKKSANAISPEVKTEVKEEAKQEVKAEEKQQIQPRPEPRQTPLNRPEETAEFYFFSRRESVNIINQKWNCLNFSLCCVF